MLAPIGLSVYARLEHLKHNIAALRRNNGAANSHLYIFSDGPKNDDFEKVSAVRNYLRQIDGFKKIELIERKQNDRVKNNRNGIDYLLNQYGKLIFLEEDIVTAPGFLDYMNNALNFYAGEKNIFSVTGYTPPINASYYCQDDVFFLPRFNAWGFGIWKDRYEKIRYIEPNDIRQLLKKHILRKYIKQYLGEDAFLMLQYDSEKIIDALDVKAIYQQILSKTLTVYPRLSLTRNIGHDGSGLHCVATGKYETTLWEKTSFVFPTQFTINSKIAHTHRKFRKLSKTNYMIYLAKRYHLYSLLRSTKSVFKAFFLRLSR